MRQYERRRGPVLLLLAAFLALGVSLVILALHRDVPSSLAFMGAICAAGAIRLMHKRSA